MVITINKMDETHQIKDSDMKSFLKIVKTERRSWHDRGAKGRF